MSKKTNEITKTNIQPSRVNPKDRILEKPEWKQQEWETEESYMKFQRWYSLPIGCSVPDYLATLGHTRSNTSEKDFKRLYDAVSQIRHNYLWNDRTKAFLEYQNTVMEKELEARRKKRLDKLERNLEVVETSCLGFIKKILEKLQNNEITFNKLEYDDALYALMRANDTLMKSAELTRKFLGEPSEITKATIDVNVGIEALKNVNITVHGSNSRLLEEVFQDG